MTVGYVDLGEAGLDAPAPVALPAELVEADARYHVLLAELPIAHYLSPANIAEARAAFTAGAEAPPFTYHPARWADDAIAALGALRIPRAHPLGAELAAAVAETRLIALALRDRTPERFHALNVGMGWHVDPRDLADTPQNIRSPERATVSSAEMANVLRRALASRGLRGWTVNQDRSMAARVSVDPSTRGIRIAADARFRPSERVGLIAHELDVHVRRSVNGAAQPLQLFSTGLARYTPAEEGLAVTAEGHVGALDPTFEARQKVVTAAVALARTAGFREVYDAVARVVGPARAWGITIRVKRGLARPGEPGVYARDVVYLQGHRAVAARLAADPAGTLRALYVGKVGLHHPVADWIAAGWVRPMPVPDLWTRYSSRKS